MKRGTWLARLTWAALPLAAGPSLAAGLDDAGRGVQVVASAGLWLVWAVVLAALALPRMASVTALRIAAPAALVAAAWAAARVDEVTARDIVALSATALATIVALAPATGDALLSGASYGDERRLPLRPPLTLLLGPIELAWAAVVAGLTAGPLLLAAERWAAGLVALAVGVPVAVIAARALHGLARRWLVLVPGGMVIHDAQALSDPILLRRASIESIGPASLDSTATDLTRGSLGLMIEVRLAAPIDLPLVRSRTEVTDVGTDRILVAPTRPGVLLAEAARRRLPVG